jgi:arylsulfatase A-like enzyme/Flp pilus assembly protein TadD
MVRPLTLPVVILAALTVVGSQQVPARPNVLLITLDTVRADRIGAYGYKLAETPNLDRLSGQGVRFSDATTQSPLTAPAHAALFTGLYPTRFGLKINGSTALPESAVTLADVLRDAGYRTAAFIGAFVLDRQYGFAQGFDHFDADFKAYRHEAKLRVQRTAEEVTAPAVAWLKRTPPGTPFFAWVHFYDAHAPYDAPPPFGPRFSSRPYDGEIAYVDAAVGRLLAALGPAALDRTIVMAVGDHGEMLGEHGEEEHGVFLYEASLHIPWIVRLPKGERAGTVIGEQVRAIDLMPTVLDLAGVPLPRLDLDGESLAPVMRGQARRDPPPSYADAHYPELHFGWSPLRSWRVGEWKYIDAPKPELYDLRVDRAEQRNVLDARATVAGRMAAELTATRRSFGAAAETAPPQPDPETLARLRSLGYIGIAAPRPAGSRGPDPKDKIQELKVFRQLLTGATADLSAGRHDTAIAKLKRAVAINDRAYDVHVLLGDAWRQKGEFENALGEYDAAALLNPEIAAPHLLAAEAHRAQGRLERALERLDTAEKIEPGSGEVAFARGRVYEQAGRANEALAAFERATRINPSDASARGRLVSVAMNIRRFDLAEPHLKILLDLGYQPARTHYALGVIAEARGDRATAAAEYMRALALEPGLKAADEGLRRVQ